MHTFKDKELKKQYAKQRKERKEQREAKRNGGWRMAALLTLVLCFLVFCLGVAHGISTEQRAEAQRRAGKHPSLTI